MDILPNVTLRSLTAFAWLLAIPSIVGAALPIDLEVALEPGTPLTAPQEWARLLGRMDLGRVQLRSIRSGERPKVEERKLGKTTRYQVLAVLNRKNELMLPKRRFRVGDRHALQKYLEQLPGQTAYHAEDRGRFGLTEKQFRQVYAELSQPVGFSTVGKSASEVAARFEKTLTVPADHLERTFLRNNGVALRNGKPLAVELQNLSTGTALAYVLRCEGLALWPEQLPGKPLRLRIGAYDSEQESWPVGWKPAVSAKRAAPQLYKFRNIEINGFTLTQALTALQPALKIPVILDDWVLGKRQIDPKTIKVSLPKKRTFLKSAVGQLVSQARLIEEVRVDELEQPFLWVTRFGKDSLPATK